MLSYEHRYLTITGQYVTGYGKNSGSWLDNTDYDGYSLFGEGKLNGNWRVIGRYDYFDPNVDLNNDGHNRMIAGIGYDFGDRSTFLVDYDRVSYEAKGAKDDSRFQATMQINF